MAVRMEDGYGGASGGGWMDEEDEAVEKRCEGRRRWSGEKRTLIGRTDCKREFRQTSRTGVSVSTRSHHTFAGGIFYIDVTLFRGNSSVDLIPLGIP